MDAGGPVRSPAVHLLALDPEPAARPAALDDAAAALAEADDDALARRGQALLGAVVDGARSAGAEQVAVIAQPTGPGAEAAAAGAGFTPVRELLELERRLPTGEPWTLDVRPFRPGEDDAAWLAVNNRAFAWHPEQGGWDAERLTATLAEPWVDLEGFLVHEGRHRLDGFCWTKAHPAADGEPARGEIFVIAVDPAAHGGGLGRALVLAGLDHLAHRGLALATLWVEADNAPALALYERLGFTERARARVFERPTRALGT